MRPSMKEVASKAAYGPASSTVIFGGSFALILSLIERRLVAGYCASSGGGILSRRLVRCCCCKGVSSFQRNTVMYAEYGNTLTKRYAWRNVTMQRVMTLVDLFMFILTLFLCHHLAAITTLLARADLQIQPLGARLAHFFAIGHCHYLSRIAIASASSLAVACGC